MGPRKAQGEDAPLDHPRRKRIYEVVQEEPGLNWNQIQRRTGLSVGTLLFHLGKLEEGGAVLRREGESGAEVHFFTPESVSLWDDPRTRVLFGHESTRRVAQIITSSPGISIQDIADEVGLHEMTIRYHLNKLRDHDLLLTEREGRRIFYHPTTRLRDRIQSIWEA